MTSDRLDRHQTDLIECLGRLLVKQQTEGSPGSPAIPDHSDEARAHERPLVLLVDLALRGGHLALQDHK